MKNNYISYYELLTMIKERDIPPRIILHLVPDKSVEYISDYDYSDSEFIGCEILKDKEADENYHYHLGDCFLESTMFDKVIEPINYLPFEEEKEIEKIIIKDMKIQAQSTGNYCYSISQPMKIIINKLNEVIDTTKELKKHLKEDK